VKLCVHVARVTLQLDLVISFMYNKNFKKAPTERQIIGKTGEDFACDFLAKKGYRIIERNYYKKWGELDIVAYFGKQLHFVEVKTVSRENQSVIHETSEFAYDYSPEDNIHPWKLQRLGRAVQSYLLDRDVSDDVDWQFDIISVYLDMDKRLLKVEMIEDIVL
jgi:putative endonuclease